MEKKWLRQSSSLTDVFNSYLKFGTCFGEAHTFVLHQRPNPQRTLMPWPQTARTEALIFQLIQWLAYQVLDDVPVQIASIKKERRRITRLYGDLSAHIGRLQYFQNYYRREMAHASRAERRRLTIVGRKNNSQLTSVLQRRREIGVQILKLNKKIEELEQQVDLIAKICEILYQQVMIGSLAMKGLRLFARETFRLSACPQREADLQETLLFCFKHEAVSDLEMTLQYADDRISHVIVIQPKALRIYDSNVGAVSYANFSLLLEDFLSYVKRDDVCGVTIEAIGTLP